MLMPAEGRFLPASSHLFVFNKVVGGRMVFKRAMLEDGKAGWRFAELCNWSTGLRYIERMSFNAHFVELLRLMQIQV